MQADSVNAHTLRQGMRQGLLLVGIMLLSLSLYLAVEWWRGPAAELETNWIEKQLQFQIPFAPGWVWVYMIPYLIGPVLAGFMSRDTFAWYVRRGLPIVFVSLLVFILVPTKTVRPPTSGLGDDLTARLYRNMIEIDGPAANAAPSLHVSLTCLLAFALMRDFPRWWTVALAGASLVWLSTLFTHQHHLIDVIGGIALAGVAALWKRPLAA